MSEITCATGHHQRLGWGHSWLRFKREARGRRPRPIGVVASLIVGVILAACSASSGSGASTTGNATPGPGASRELLAFARCMRENGVPNFPDPVEGRVPDNAEDLGGDQAAFDAAWKACESLLSSPRSGAAGNAAGSTGWERIVPGGNCVCADGSEFAFWERRADPDKVAFYLDGGGICIDAETCAFTGTAGESDVYNWSLEGENPAFPGGGILDFDNAQNPLADYSFIYVASCTGDADLGDVTREYSKDLTVEHNGFVNGTAALGYLADHYADAAKVVVVGRSSGSVAAPVYGGLVADLVPDARVTVFGAESGAFPDDPDFNAEVLGQLWGAYQTMPDWEVNEGLTARDWGIRRFWIQAGLHDPEIVLARFDFAFDPNMVRTVEALTGIDASNLVAMIDANEAAIEAAGVVQHSYTAPGDEHLILEVDRFYEIEVNGVMLADWVEALLASEPPEDVHCDPCTGA
jgi:Pectinacetylesterase